MTNDRKAGENIMNIEKEIDAHIHKRGGGYPAWYVGIAKNPRERLFEGHNVSEQSGTWLYRDAGSELTAKTMEAMFLKKGCKGGPGGGDSSRYIYAYKMTRTTRGSKS